MAHGVRPGPGPALAGGFPLTGPLDPIGREAARSERPASPFWDRTNRASPASPVPYFAINFALSKRRWTASLRNSTIFRLSLSSCSRPRRKFRQLLVPPVRLGAVVTQRNSPADRHCRPLRLSWRGSADGPPRLPAARRPDGRSTVPHAAAATAAAAYGGLRLRRCPRARRFAGQSSCYVDR